MERRTQLEPDLTLCSGYLTEPGLEIIVQLSIRTERQFSSPTGIIGNYNHGKGREISIG